MVISVSIHSKQVSLLESLVDKTSSSAVSEEHFPGNKGLLTPNISNTITIHKTKIHICFFTSLPPFSDC